jgi:seryl-tRNA synthetase
MLDINFIRENQQRVKEACQNKNLDGRVVDELLSVDEKRRLLMVQIQKVRQKRNQLDKNIKGKPDPTTIKKGKELKEKLAQLEPELKDLEVKFKDLMLRTPNVTDESVPVGKDASGNVVIRKWGDIPKLDFPIKDHIQLGQNLRLIDFERGAKLAGFRGYVLKNEAVLLELGILFYALEKLIKKGFIPVIPPVLVKEFCFTNSGHFPWGKKETYQTSSGEKEEDVRWLAGTAEVPLVSYHAGEIFNEKDLPLLYCGFSPCFRREIGNYGKDTRGTYRIHEFLKVEQVVLCRNDWKESEKWHEALLKNSEEILQELNLPYRVMLMCTGDMGEPQAKKYDIETWMPGRGEYGETMSDSIMTDFQSRRANIKYRTKNGELKYVHMLNNTAVASPRILIAILENYQTREGWVRVPEVLQKYVGKEIIK